MRVGVVGRERVSALWPLPHAGCYEMLLKIVHLEGRRQTHFPVSFCFPLDIKLPALPAFVNMVLSVSGGVLG